MRYVAREPTVAKSSSPIAPHAKSKENGVTHHITLKQYKAKTKTKDERTARPHALKQPRLLFDDDVLQHLLRRVHVPLRV
jgi:hypothetical protein